MPWSVSVNDQLIHSGRPGCCVACDAANVVPFVRRDPVSLRDYAQAATPYLGSPPEPMASQEIKGEYAHGGLYHLFVNPTALEMAEILKLSSGHTANINLLSRRDFAAAADGNMTHRQMHEALTQHAHALATQERGRKLADGVGKWCAVGRPGTPIQMLNSEGRLVNRVHWPIALQTAIPPGLVIGDGETKVEYSPIPALSIAEARKVADPENHPLTANIEGGHTVDYGTPGMRKGHHKASSPVKHARESANAETLHAIHEHLRLRTPESHAAVLRAQEAARKVGVADGEFKEAEHPRAKGGEFTTKKGRNALVPKALQAKRAPSNPEYFETTGEFSGQDFSIDVNPTGPLLNRLLDKHHDLRMLMPPDSPDFAVAPADVSIHADLIVALKDYAHPLADESLAAFGGEGEGGVFLTRAHGKVVVTSYEGADASDTDEQVPEDEWPDSLRKAVHYLNANTMRQTIDINYIDADFKESEHPRGQPGNAGQFGKNSAEKQVKTKEGAEVGAKEHGAIADLHKLMGNEPASTAHWQASGAFSWAREQYNHPKARGANNPLVLHEQALVLSAKAHAKHPLEIPDSEVTGQLASALLKYTQPTPSEAEKNNLDKYSGEGVGSYGYYKINAALRDQSKATPATTTLINSVTRYLSRVEVPVAMRVYRGIDGAIGNKVMAEAKVGKVFTDLGFASTSSSKKFAETWVGNDADSLVMEVRLPAGTHAAPVTRKGSMDWQGEILIQRGSNFVVESWDKASKKLVVRVEQSNAPMPLTRKTADTVDIKFIDADGAVQINFPPDWTLEEIRNALEESNQLQQSEMYFGDPRLNAQFFARQLEGEDAGFDPSAHPRGQPENKGEFAPKGGGGMRGALQRGAGAMRGAVRSAVGQGTSAVRRFGSEDQHVLHQAFSQERPGDRNVVAHHLYATARALPGLLKTHLQEEGHNALHTAGALRKLAVGQRPTPEQMKGLRSFAARVLMTSAGFAMGDPTGALGHGAGQLAMHLGHEVMQHVAVEHALKAMAGVGRVVLGRAKPHVGEGDAAFVIGDDDIALLQHFVNALAAAILKLDEATAQALLVAHPTADAEFEESEHPRDKDGKFGSGGRLMKTERVAGRAVITINPSQAMLNHLLNRSKEGLRVLTNGDDVALADAYETEHEQMVLDLDAAAHPIVDTSTGYDLSGLFLQYRRDGGKRAVASDLILFEASPNGEVPVDEWPRGLRRATGLTTDAEFEESEHPRGQPDNPGQFVAGVGGAAEVAGQPAKQGRVAASAHLTPASPDRTQWPDHIRRLVIPPAWRNVRISQDPDANLLAQGQDAKDRWQSIYNAKFKATQAEAKFARIAELDKKFESIKAQNAKNRSEGDEYVRQHADITSLIMAMGIRPGSERDTGAVKRAYGATTLLGKHLVQLKSGPRLRFIGKDGVSLDLPVEDLKIAKMLERRANLAGPSGQLFPNVSDSSLRDYIHGFDGGGFKTKDIRTLIGTRTAARQVAAKSTAPNTLAEYKRAVREIATEVSHKLGNTPTIALQSYIDPSVWQQWKSTAGVP